ncbi:hypothetical protein GGX14DRAFT_600114 [Mycena pura]|uniref:Uncharacterized protein n=1 Tax=Mycena pura TaxID=153505 RepID=A0AAD6UNZ0_9AGAR|nr:hypothetical protein GGX14DRAFT_600114 [Mycena pura]
MAVTEASWDFTANDFVGAIACLDDITTIHTDNNLAHIRAKLMTSRSDDEVWVLEVHGIAQRVVKRFRSGTPHHSHATEAASDAAMLCAADLTSRWTVRGEDEDEDEDSYWLDWVPVRDRASADTHTCLCPVTVYLQMILCHTPMEDWAAALTDPDPDASPLGFAWALACRSPCIGARTAGVAVLVTMGRHVHRLMVYAPVRAEEKRLAAENQFQQDLYNEGHPCCAALAIGVRACFMRAAKWLRHPPSKIENYRRMLEAEHARKLLAEIQNAAEMLGKEGQRYAQLLAEKDRDGARDRELEDVVVSIRTWAGFILGKADPPVPQTVLPTLDGLATLTTNY